MFDPTQLHVDSDIRRAPQPQPAFAGIRRYNRRQLTVDVVVQDRDGWEIPLESVDISPTGIFVRSDFLFEVGEEHVLIFEVQGRGIFRLHGRVVRVEDPERGSGFGAGIGVSPGMAYEFIETREDAWQDLCAMVAGN